MHRVPPYQGFEWDHPLMVHWRKTHTVSPGIQELIRPKLFTLLGVSAGGALLGIFGVKDGQIALALTGGVLIGLGIAITALFSDCERTLVVLSGEHEFCGLVLQLKELLEFPSGLDRDIFLWVHNWPEIQRQAREVLIDYARAIVVSEKTGGDLSFCALPLLRDAFKTRFNVFEEAGLIEGGEKGHLPFFDTAKQRLAKADLQKRVLEELTEPEPPPGPPMRPPEL